MRPSQMLPALRLMSAGFLLAMGLTATPAAAGNGALVLIGGGLRNNNAEVYQEMVRLAGGKEHGRIAVVPLAAWDPMAAGQGQVKIFQQYGIDAWMVPIGNSKILKNAEQEAANPEWAAKVRQSTGVYFCGGTQQRLTEGGLYTADGGSTPLLEAIRSVYAKGGLIAGTSAGAFAMNDTMLGADLDVLDILKKGTCEPGKELFRGLGFLGQGVMADFHANTKGRFARLPVAMKSHGDKLGFAVDEGTAAVLETGEAFKVVGPGGVTVIDLAEASSAPAAGFNLRNIRITYLENGDSFNLKTREVKVNAVKARLDPKNPGSHDKVATQDILGNTAFADLIYSFIGNAEQEAVGLAFSLRADKKNNDWGYKFAFRKSADTEGYYTGSWGVSSYSAKNVFLDISPITVSAPFYSDRK